MSHIIHVQLDDFVDGFFVIQPAYNAEEFAKIIDGRLPRDFANAYAEVYRDFIQSKSGTIVCDGKSPWVIVVIGSAPQLIRRRALQEIVQLAKAVTRTEEMRYRFIDRAYAAVRIP
jgi:hypothetical protein